MRLDTVTFGTPRLTGVVVRPSGRGPFPGVVLIHGSGPDDGASYLHYARAFAANGVAALVYDKRGFGQSGGDWRWRTLDSLTKDALSAVRALRRVDGVAPDNVGVWGISQGGWIVARAASRDTSLAFAVAVAGGVVSPTEQEMYHKTRMFEAAGFSAPMQVAALRLWRMLFDGLVQYAHGRVPVPNGVLDEPLAAARFGLDHDPTADWRRVGARVSLPVLVIFGALDQLSPVDESVRRLAALLAISDTSPPANAPRVVRVVPSASHTITTATVGLFFDWDSAFAPGYLTSVPEWIRSSIRLPRPAADVAMRTDSVPRGADFDRGGRYGPLPIAGRFWSQFVAILVFACVFSGYLMRCLWRCVRPVHRSKAGRGALASPPVVLAMLTSTLGAALLVGWAGLALRVWYPAGLAPRPALEIPVTLRALPVAGAAFTVLAAWLGTSFILSARRHGAADVSGRAVSIVGVTAVAFVGWLSYWQLIGQAF